MEKLSRDKVRELFIRKLNSEDFVPEFLANYKHYQKVEKILRWVNGEKILVHHPFIEDGSPESCDIQMGYQL